MQRRTIGIPVIAALVLLSLSCVGTVSTAMSHSSETAEAAVFRVAVEVLHEQLAPSVFVDPRPLKIAADIAYPNASDYHEAGEAAPRARILSAIGVDTTTAIPLIAECGPLLSPPSLRVTAGCPPDRRVEIALDQARPGVGPGDWTIRAIWIVYWPNAGRHASIADLTVSRSPAGYVVRNQALIARIE
jgi:hypothetical protein